MKNIIVIIGTVILGLIIFDLLVGDGTSDAPSLREASEGAFTGALMQFG